MLKKKSFWVFLILLFTLCGISITVNMQQGDITCVQLSGSVMKISGVADARTRVTLNVLPAGKTYEELRNTDDPISVLLHHDQVRADDNGTFSFRVGLDVTGDYTAYVKIGKNAVQTVGFTFDADAVIEKDNPVIFEADFETGNYADYGFVYAGRTSGGDSATVTQKDAAHGQSLYLQQPSDASSLYKIFDEPLKDRCIMVQYSYLREGTGNLFFLRYANSDLPSPDHIRYGSETRTVRQSFFSIDGRASVYRNGRGWSRSEDDGDYLAEKENDWNDVIIYYDYPHGEISYFLNGQLLYIAEMDIGMEDLYGLAWCVYKPNPLWLDNIKVSELTRASETGLPETSFPEKLRDYSNRSVDIDFESGKTGHIFGESPAFDITFTERDARAGDFTVTYTVKDEYGDTVWTKKAPLSLERWSRETVKLELPIDKYGVYYLYADLTSENHGEYSTFTQFSLVNLPLEEYHNRVFGMVMHPGQGRDYVEQVALADLAGVGIMRDEFSWGKLETSEGVWEFPEDQVAYWKDLADRGITFYFNLSYGGPSWRGDVGSDTYIEGYGEWAYQMTKKFNELGLDFMIGTYNEWNHYGTIDPTWYAGMLKACYEGVKRADPNVLVVGGETSGVPTEMLEGVFTALNGEKVMDAWSHHIYTYHGYDTPEELSHVTLTAELRRILDAYGYTDLPIWLTETGWSTMTGWATERQQAQFITRTMARQAAEKPWEVVLWYDFQNDGTYRTPRESNFGIIETFWPSWDHPEAMAAKPAYLSYANYNALLCDAVYTNKVSLGSDIFCYQYEKPNSNILYAVADTAKTVSMQTDCEEFTVYDMYGNATPHYTVDGILTLQLGLDPIYVEGDFGYLFPCTVKNGFTIQDMGVTKNGTAVTEASELAVGDTVTASVKLINNTAAERPYHFLFGVYNGDRLTDVYFEEGTVKAYLSANPSFDFTVEDTDDLSVKVMLWDGSMVPYLDDVAIE